MRQRMTRFIEVLQSSAEVIVHIHGCTRNITDSMRATASTCCTLHVWREWRRPLFQWWPREYGTMTIILGSECHNGVLTAALFYNLLVFFLTENDVFVEPSCEWQWSCWLQHSGYCIPPLQEFSLIQIKNETVCLMWMTTSIAKMINTIRLSQQSTWGRSISLDERLCYQYRRRLWKQ